MSLVKCKDCGNPVSNKAEACPRCGKPPVDKRVGGSTPIVSPWAVYICGSVGKLRLFFLLTALLTAIGAFFSLSINSWALVFATSVGFAVSFTMTFALPSRKTGIAMIVASKITKNSPQKIRDVVDILINSKEFPEE